MDRDSDIQQALRLPIDLDFERTSLDNVLKYISAVADGISIVIDPETALAGIDLTTRVVDLKVSRVPIESVLDLILGVDLGYRIGPGYVLITTREKLQQNLQMRTYAVRDLVQEESHLGAIAEGLAGWQVLVDIVQRTVNNQSDPDVAAWADEGGPASVEYLNGKLIITQTDRGHERVADLLAQLRAGDEVRLRTEEVRVMKEQPTVFVVHGQDVAAKAEMARFLEKLDLSVVILQERPRGSATIIESIERCACGVDFAVVLLTRDDLGAAKSEVDNASTESEKLAKLAPRARQNVVFELGFFVGRLTRDRVCVLRRGGLEIVSELSDLHGVLCLEMDESGAWRQNLARVLKEAGFQVDLNRLIA
ncbi:MAG TPA: nucleotide-binding protein [Phycisphaerae bacterium]|nr:nucleotide-binding protein [Phycisphaerae bacterium]